MEIYLLGQGKRLNGRNWEAIWLVVVPRQTRLQVMGTAALHGYWTHYSRKRHPIPRSLDEFRGLSSLINSCKLWGEDGPIMKEIRTVLANEHGPGA